MQLKMKIIFLLSLSLSLVFGVELVSKDGAFERVHGGHTAVDGQFPWNAAVFNSTDFLCSAVLITNKYLLTSAECVVPYQSTPWAVTVHLGSVDNNLGSSYNIDNININPNYPRTITDVANIYHAYNIAILKHTAGIPISTSIAPIALTTSEVPIDDGTHVQLCGWGAQGDKVLPNLEFAYMSTKNVYTCIQEIGGNPSVEYYYNLCTPGFQPGTGVYSGACYFDHGAGLIQDYNSATPLLVGLVSYANCDSSLPTIYTSIVAHSNWIVSNTP